MEPNENISEEQFETNNVDFDGVVYAYEQVVIENKKLKEEKEALIKFIQKINSLAREGLK